MASDYEEIIKRASQLHGVSPDLIRRVLRTESAGNPRAVSSKGARGLMQLMPDTAKEVGVTNPDDPEQNIMGGTKYLRKMLDRYNGDETKALAAYNWGPGNLDKRGLNNAPIETRNYVQKIANKTIGGTQQPKATTPQPKSDLDKFFDDEFGDSSTSSATSSPSPAPSATPGIKTDLDKFFDDEFGSSAPSTPPKQVSIPKATTPALTTSKPTNRPIKPNNTAPIQQPDTQQAHSSRMNLSEPLPKLNRAMADFDPRFITPSGGLKGVTAGNHDIYNIDAPNNWDKLSPSQKRTYINNKMKVQFGYQGGAKSTFNLPTPDDFLAKSQPVDGKLSVAIPKESSDYFKKEAEQSLTFDPKTQQLTGAKNFTQLKKNQMDELRARRADTERADQMDLRAKGHKPSNQLDEVPNEIVLSEGGRALPRDVIDYSKTRDVTEQGLDAAGRGLESARRIQQAVTTASPADKTSDVSEVPNQLVKGVSFDTLGTRQEAQTPMGMYANTVGEQIPAAVATMVAPELKIAEGAGRLSNALNVGSRMALAQGGTTAGKEAIQGNLQRNPTQALQNIGTSAVAGFAGGALGEVVPGVTNPNATRADLIKAGLARFGYNAAGAYVPEVGSRVLQGQDLRQAATEAALPALVQGAAGIRGTDARGQEPIMQARQENIAHPNPAEARIPSTADLADTTGLPPDLAPTAPLPIELQRPSRSQIAQNAVMRRAQEIPTMQPRQTGQGLDGYTQPQAGRFTGINENVPAPSPYLTQEIPGASNLPPGQIPVGGETTPIDYNQRYSTQPSVMNDPLNLQLEQQNREQAALANRTQGIPNPERTNELTANDFATRQMEKPPQAYNTAKELKTNRMAPRTSPVGEKTGAIETPAEARRRQIMEAGKLKESDFIPFDENGIPLPMRDLPIGDSDYEPNFKATPSDTPIDKEFPGLMNPRKRGTAAIDKPYTNQLIPEADLANEPTGDLVAKQNDLLQRAAIKAERDLKLGRIDQEEYDAKMAWIKGRLAANQGVKVPIASKKPVNKEAGTGEDFAPPPVEPPKQPARLTEQAAKEPTVKMPQVDRASSLTDEDQLIAKLKALPDSERAALLNDPKFPKDITSLRKMLDDRGKLTPEQEASLPPKLKDIINSIPKLTDESTSGALKKLEEFPGLQANLKDAIAAQGGVEPPAGKERNLLRQEAVYKNTPAGSKPNPDRSITRVLPDNPVLTENRNTLAKSVAKFYPTKEAFLEAVTKGALDPDTRTQLRDVLYSSKAGKKAALEFSTPQLEKLYQDGVQALKKDPNFMVGEKPIKSVRVGAGDKALVPPYPEAPIQKPAMKPREQGKPTEVDPFEPTDNVPYKEPSGGLDESLKKGDEAAKFFENLGSLDVKKPTEGKVESVKTSSEPVRQDAQDSLIKQLSERADAKFAEGYRLNKGTGISSPVGAEGFRNEMEGQVIREFIRNIRTGKSAKEAAEATNEFAKQAVQKHNARRPNDRGWMFSDTYFGSQIDDIMRSFYRIEQNTTPNQSKPPANSEPVKEPAPAKEAYQRTTPVKGSKEREELSTKIDDIKAKLKELEPKLKKATDTRAKTYYESEAYNKADEKVAKLSTEVDKLDSELKQLRKTSKKAFLEDIVQNSDEANALAAKMEMGLKSSSGVSYYDQLKEIIKEEAQKQGITDPEQLDKTVMDVAAMISGYPGATPLAERVQLSGNRIRKESRRYKLEDEIDNLPGLSSAEKQGFKRRIKDEMYVTSRLDTVMAQAREASVKGQEKADSDARFLTEQQKLKAQNLKPFDELQPLPLSKDVWAGNVLENGEIIGSNRALLKRSALDKKSVESLSKTPKDRNAQLNLQSKVARFFEKQPNTVKADIAGHGENEALAYLLDANNQTYTTNKNQLKYLMAKTGAKDITISHYGSDEKSGYVAQLVKNGEVVGAIPIGKAEPAFSLDPETARAKINERLAAQPQEAPVAPKPKKAPRSRKGQEGFVNIELPNFLRRRPQAPQQAADTANLPLDVNHLPRLQEVKPKDSLATVVGSYYKANLLANPAGIVKDLIGTQANVKAQELVIKPIAGAVDSFIGLFTKRRSVMAPDLAGFKQSQQAAFNALKELPSRVRGKYPDQARELEHLDVNELNSGLKPLDWYVNTNFRARGAVDNVNFKEAFSASVNEQVAIMAENIAKANPAWGKEAKNRFITDMRQAIHNEANGLNYANRDANVRVMASKMMTQAVADAEVATFNNKNLASETVKGARKFLEQKANQGNKMAAIGQLLLDTQLPFVRAKTNTIVRLLKLTPAGAAADIGRVAYRAAVNRAFSQADQRSLSMAIANGAAGSALMALGYYLAGDQRIARLFSYNPSDKTTKEEAIKNQAAQRPGGSVEIGGRNWQISDLQPLGGLILLGGAMRYEFDQAKSVGEKALGVAKEGANIALSHPFAQGLIAANQEFSKEGLAKAAIKTATNLVPTPITWAQYPVAAAMGKDYQERKITPFKDNPAESIKQSFQEKIPGLREDLPADITALGETREKQTSAVSPFASRPSKREDFPAITELDRLGVGMSELKKNPDQSDSDYERVAKKVGANTKASLNAVVASEPYKSAPQEVQKQILREVQTATKNYKDKEYGQVDPYAIRHNVEVEQQVKGLTDSLSNIADYKSLSFDEQQKVRAAVKKELGNYRVKPYVDQDDPKGRKFEAEDQRFALDDLMKDATKGKVPYFVLDIIDNVIGDRE